MRFGFEFLVYLFFKSSLGDSNVQKSKACSRSFQEGPEDPASSYKVTGLFELCPQFPGVQQESLGSRDGPNGQPPGPAQTCTYLLLSETFQFYLLYKRVSHLKRTTEILKMYYMFFLYLGTGLTNWCHS